LTTQAKDDTRLSDLVLNLPEKLDKYFNAKKHRTPLWSGISLFTGFYIGNVVNLTFGTLGVNDVVAAAMVVAGSEIITKKFYTDYYSGRLSTTLTFANFFKMGCAYSFIIDAFKLGG